MKGDPMALRRVAVAIVVLFGLMGMVTQVNAASFVVCPSGCPYDTIQAAVNASSPDSVIVIRAGSYAGPITLDKNETLIGSGSNTTIINGGGPVISVEPGVTVRLSGVTVTGGDGIEGGGIMNSGTLTLLHSSVNSNTAVDAGAGIFNDGKLTLVLTSITHNVAEGPFGSAGGIHNSGTMDMLNSSVSDNGAAGAGGISNFGTMTLWNSRVTNNTAIIAGGIENRKILTMRNSIVKGNSVTGDPSIGGGVGGGIENTGTLLLQHSQISENTALADPFGVNEDTGFGGGIYSTDGTVTIQTSLVTRNTADRDGGGIFNTATLTLELSLVTNNTAHRDGGGIFNSGGTVTLRLSPVRGNDPNDCVGC
jgi:hypothetical protein